MFDRLVECIPNVRFLSGECPTVATAARRNHNRRTPGARRNPGCLHDGVIKYGDHEIGAVENGGCNIAPDSEKWVGDLLKIAKSNRDMIVKFHSTFGISGREIPALGIVTAGLSFETVRMRYGGGLFVCWSMTLSTPYPPFYTTSAQSCKLWFTCGVSSRTRAYYQYNNCASQYASSDSAPNRPNTARVYGY